MPNKLLPNPAPPVRDIHAWETLVLHVATSRLDREKTTNGLSVLLLA
ncbi:MAG: hypothetical protein M3329_09745 [Pseudomonadota bacterium]|nr:hypothetical protein [Pseudomonadota bacterium]